MPQELRMAPAPVAPPTDTLVGNYFVAAYPPFSCWEPGQVGSAEPALDGDPPQSPVGIYVHIPFCERKCDYCYYMSREGAKASEVDAYLASVVEELRLVSQRPAMAGREATYLYVGGGTPSTLRPEQITFLLSGLRSAVPWQDDAEVTFEVAPKTARPDRLEALRDGGVTRVSMGVQSFDDDLLRLNGRIHLAEDVERAYALLRDHDFAWVNLDLMVGMLAETDDSWERSVERVLNLAPDRGTM